MSAVQKADRDVELILAPGLRIDEGNLARWCQEWGDVASVNIHLAAAADRETMIANLSEAAGKGAVGIVLCAGTESESERVRAATANARIPVVWVDLEEAERTRPSYVDESGMAVRGRGIHGIRWALQLLLQRLEWPYQTIPYGSLRDQVGDLRLPANPSGPAPVVVLLHGGFWRERWERDTIEPLAIDLAQRGYATWNLEYRRVGPYGGGWPWTCEDVASGIDFVAQLGADHPVDVGRLAIVGHSAGGHLALWAAKRRGVSGSPIGRLSLIVSLAGIADVPEAALRGLGDTGNGTADFMGGSPEQLPDAYADASPTSALPLGVPQLIVQGRLDNSPDLVDLSPSYVQRARECGDEVTFLEFDDANHFDIIDPTSAAWLRVADEIERRFPKRAKPLAEPISLRE